MRLAWLALCLSGCQCLVVVDEAPDGGLADSGAVDECATPADCGGAFTTVYWCQGDGGADWSCVDHRCVPQCQGHGGQTCETGSNRCLQCPPDSACVAPSCDGLRDTRWHLEQVACDAEPFLPGDVLHQVADAGCGMPLFLERDGGSTLYGHLYLQEPYAMTAHIDALGGACLVSGLPTGLERVVFECPRCQFVLVNW